MLKESSAAAPPAKAPPLLLNARAVRTNVPDPPSERGPLSPVIGGSLAKRSDVGPAPRLANARERFRPPIRPAYWPVPSAVDERRGARAVSKDDEGPLRGARKDSFVGSGDPCSIPHRAPVCRECNAPHCVSGRPNKESLVRKV